MVLQRGHRVGVGGTIAVCNCNLCSLHYSYVDYNLAAVSWEGWTWVVWFTFCPRVAPGRRAEVRSGRPLRMQSPENSVCLEDDAHECQGLTPEDKVDDDEYHVDLPGGHRA